jgi:hypothetical protein
MEAHNNRESVQAISGGRDALTKTPRAIRAGVLTEL